MPRQTEEERRKEQLKRLKREKAAAADEKSDEKKDSLLMQALSKIADIIPGRGKPGMIHKTASVAQERERRRREILGME